MNRVVESCPVCDKTAVWIDVVTVPTGQPDQVLPDGTVIENVTFQIKPGVISCSECKAELELSVHECGRHTLRAL